MRVPDIAGGVTDPVLETYCLDLGNAVWQLRSRAEGLRIELDRRMMEFVNQRGPSPDVTIDICWAEDLCEVESPLFDAGPWRAYPAADGLQFDFFTHILGPQPYRRAIFDTEFNRGQVFLNRKLLGNVDSYYPLEYPLDELVSMHRLAHGSGVELHSCGLATDDGRGYLFVGHSGAGKSTLGKSWVKHRGATILSDDRVIVTKADTGYRMHGTPWHGEAGLACNASAELRAIFLIQHGDRNQTLSLKPFAASAELLSRSFVPWYRPQDIDFSMNFLQELAQRIPVYVFRCLPDVSAVEYLERTHAI